MRLKYVGLSVLLVIAAINFTRITFEIVKSSKRLDDVKGEISLLGQQKTDLEKSIEYKKSDDFIEKTARNELNLAKSGESVYVIRGLVKDEAKIVENGSGVLSAVSTSKRETKTIEDRINNLKLWIKLLF